MSLFVQSVNEYLDEHHHAWICVEIIPEVYWVIPKASSAFMAYDSRIVIDTRGVDMVIRTQTHIETTHATFDSLIQQITDVIEGTIL